MIANHLVNNFVDYALVIETGLDSNGRKKKSLMGLDGNDTDDTSPTYKVLEEGANTLSKEETTRLAQRQLKFIQGLQAALVRIENKTYGICRETGKLIPAERLRAVPHATLSIEAKNSGKK